MNNACLKIQNCSNFFKTSKSNKLHFTVGFSEKIGKKKEIFWRRGREGGGANGEKKLKKEKKAF